MKRKTFCIKEKQIKREKLVIDAKGKILGRLATEIASILRGKTKSVFYPHQDVGDYVLVKNAAQIATSGDKERSKIYFTHSGYPHGHKLLNLSEKKRRDPRHILKLAVAGMLPKGPLGRSIIKKLTIEA